MAVLSSREVQRRLKRSIEDPKSLVVSPLLAPDESFDVDSLDLRLGCYFLVPRVPAFPFYSPDSQSSFSFHRRVHVPLGDFLVVPAHQTVLGATLEFIKLPYDVAGEILTKSSVARTFTVIETAPWVHPNYRGCLTLEIANASNSPMLLYPGRRIGQLVLTEVSGEKSRKAPAGDSELNRTYFGPVFPEPPEFRDPEVDLERIGIRNVRIIRRPEWSASRRADFCFNGHYTTPLVSTSRPHRKRRFCEKCGAQTIHTCPNCGVPFENPAMKASSTAARRDPSPPAHCSACGLALPWTRLHAVTELAELQGKLNPEELAELRARLHDLIAATPLSRVAAQKVKILLAKAGATGVQEFQAILAPILPDADVETLFPST